jgi:hypothetical protein
MIPFLKIIFNFERGAEMQGFLWAIGSLFILGPIIYFLPLGVSTRGKWMIVILSFFLGIIGLLAQDVLPLWETIISTMVLCGLLVYIMDKRLGGILYSLVNSTVKEKIPPNELDESLTIEKDSNEPFYMEELSMLEVGEALESNKHQSAEFLLIGESIPQFPGDISDETTGKGESGEIIEMHEIWDEQISHMENSDQLPLANKAEFAELELTVSEENYLSEIENLVNQAIPNSEENELTEHKSQDSTETFLTVEEDSLRGPQASSDELWPLEEKIMDQNIKENDTYQADSDLVDAFPEGLLHMNDLNPGILEHSKDHFLLNQEIVAAYGETAATANEMIKVEEVEENINDLENEHSIEENAFELETGYIEEEPAVDVEHEHSEEKLAVDFKNDQSVEQNTPVFHSRPLILRKELLHTMVSQLKIARKNIDPLEYENLVRNHMHPRLSVQEYFTFASLLIEHFIHTKDYIKLESLINNIREKTEGYPILEEQLEFIHKRYCQKLK